MSFCERMTDELLALLKIILISSNPPKTKSGCAADAERWLEMISEQTSDCTEGFWLIHRPQKGVHLPKLAQSANIGSLWYKSLCRGNTYISCCNCHWFSLLSTYVLLLPIKEKYHLKLSVSILINLSVDPLCIITCCNAVVEITGLEVSLVTPNRNLALQPSLIAVVCIAFLSTPQTNYSVAITDAVSLDLNGNT